jgi:hypothetical protein
MRGREREIKYFPPARDDNTWKKLGICEHTGEYKYVETHTDRLEMGSAQILGPSHLAFVTPPPPTPKRETCAEFLEEGEEETRKVILKNSHEKHPQEH